MSTTPQVTWRELRKLTAPNSYTNVFALTHRVTLSERQQRRLRELSEHATNEGITVQTLLKKMTIDQMAAHMATQPEEARVDLETMNIPISFDLEDVTQQLQSLHVTFQLWFGTYLNGVVLTSDTLGENPQLMQQERVFGAFIGVNIRPTDHVGVSVLLNTKARREMYETKFARGEWLGNLGLGVSTLAANALSWVSSLMKARVVFLRTDQAVHDFFNAAVVEEANILVTKLLSE
jgi:hypothetical protein